MSEKQKAGIVIESWKEKHFVAQLQADGFDEFTVNPPSEIGGEACVVIEVMTDEPRRLEQTIRTAQAIARKKRRH